MSMYADLGDTHHRVDSDSLPIGSGVAGDLVGVVCRDSSAAIAVSHRKGCGKLRYIRIGQLWIQERINTKDLSLRKVLGEENPADLRTKHLMEQKKERHCEKLAKSYQEGRSSIGLRMQQGRAGNGAKVV